MDRHGVTADGCVNAKAINDAKPLPEDVAAAVAALRRRTRHSGGASSGGAPLQRPSARTGGQTTGGGAAAAGRQAQACQPVAVSSGEGPPGNYIPLRYPELRDRLVADHPAAFTAPGALAAFARLAASISLSNRLRLLRALSPLLERYAVLDPDAATPLPDPLPGQGLSCEKRAALAGEFEDGMHELLLAGGFQQLSEHQLRRSLAAQGLGHGLAVVPPDPAAVRYRVYVRGLRTQEVRHRSWRTLYLQRRAQVPAYKRVALVFRARSGTEVAAAAAAAEGGHGLGVWCRWLARLLRRLRRREVRVGDEALSPGWVHLRLFKDIETSDADMLLPGSVAAFTLLDWALILGPVVFGLVSAVVKAARGTLDFRTAANAASSALLVVLPITWALRAYLAVAAKRAEYTAHLNRMFLMHALASNAGVLALMLDSAREQDENEALLAYFFLWRGQHSPTPLSQAALDCAAEAWVNGLVGPALPVGSCHCSGGGSGGCGGGGGGGGGDGGGGRSADKGVAGGSKREATPHVDFEVHDAVDKLTAMGVVHPLPGAGEALPAGGCASRLGGWQPSGTFAGGGSELVALGLDDALAALTADIQAAATAAAEGPRAAQASGTRASSGSGAGSSRGLQEPRRCSRGPSELLSSGSWDLGAGVALRIPGTTEECGLLEGVDATVVVAAPQPLAGAPGASKRPDRSLRVRSAGLCQQQA